MIPCIEPLPNWFALQLGHERLTQLNLVGLPLSFISAVVMSIGEILSGRILAAHVLLIRLIHLNRLVFRNWIYNHLVLRAAQHLVRV